MKARRLGDPERPDQDEEDLFLMRRGRALGFGLAGRARQRAAVTTGGRAERFPGVDVDPSTRDDRDVWYQDPIKSSKQ